ncbi:MAG: uridine diphosphate-N-acetylglucosamine-binding protein YvcK [Anaeromyxobacteraceae bacterium]
MIPAPQRAAPALVVAPPLRVAAVGGGTGVPRVLAGLAAAARDPARGLGGPVLGPRGAPRRALEVTAGVATSDDGGSSGELRRRYGVPSPGDIRNCLVALSAGPGPLAALFQHRFDGEGSLAGHTVGNVVLTALAQQLGDFSLAVRAAGQLLGVRGAVVPATERSVELVATLDDGRVIRGESAIAAARGTVGRLALDGPAPAPPEALAAVRGADLVVLGPGSLYSSVIAALLVDGMADALASCRGVRVLVVNLFTQPGETDGYGAADHVRAIERHLGRVVDVALLHAAPAPPRLVESYAAQESHPVRLDRDALEAMGVVVAEADLLAPGGDTARHDPGRRAAALLGLAR